MDTYAYAVIATSNTNYVFPGTTGTIAHALMIVDPPRTDDLVIHKVDGSTITFTTGTEWPIGTIIPIASTKYVSATDGKIVALRKATHSESLIGK